MIGFSELRKKSVEWQTELDTVERIYALDWVIKGLFDRDPLAAALALRAASALANAYFPDYPRLEDVDFAWDPNISDVLLEAEIRTALGEATRASGLQFRLAHFQPSEARVEFTGPLGRRSAAQPLIVVRFAKPKPRTALYTGQLVHPFSDDCKATVQAVALEELAAQRIVWYSQKPRARDVFDLWFILTRGAAMLNRESLDALVQQIALEKRVTLRTELDPQYAPLLASSWDNALKAIRQRPPFAQARADIETQLASA